MCTNLVFLYIVRRTRGPNFAKSLNKSSNVINNTKIRHSCRQLFMLFSFIVYCCAHGGHPWLLRSKSLFGQNSSLCQGNVASEKKSGIFFFAFDALQCLLLVNLAYNSVGNFKKNPNIVQSSSIAVPALVYIQLCACSVEVYLLLEFYINPANQKKANIVFFT